MPAARPAPNVVRPAPASTEVGDQQKVIVTPGQDSSDSSRWPLYLLALVAVAILILVRYRRRRDEEVVRDSDAFAEALQVWTPVVAKRNSAPRSIKRFGNRLRYFAMLQQAENLSGSEWKGRMQRLRSLFARNGSDVAAKPRPRVDIVAEHRIVALGAIQTVYADDWRKHIENGLAKAATNGDPNDPTGIGPAVKAYVERTKAGWPPSCAELDAFELSLRGIRVEGEASILSAEAGRASETASASGEPSASPEPRDTPDSAPDASEQSESAQSASPQRTS
jgi:hypothetical protein